MPVANAPLLDVCSRCVPLADLLHISRQSCYLIGRDRAVADIPIEHPSCSKQHAALQFRLIVKRNEFGDETKTIK